MFHLVMTACLSASPSDCAPILLPPGDSPTREGCLAGHERIADDWLRDHPDLIRAALDCLPNARLPAADLQEVAPGVFVHFGQVAQMESSPDGRIANLGVILGDSVAVIDAGVSRAEGQALYVALRRLTDRPIGQLVLTHLHPDHILGASVMAEAGAEILAHAAYPVGLEVRGPVYLDAIRRLYPVAEWLGTALVAPDRLVTGAETIDLGDRLLHVHAVASAHTDSDLTVYDPTTGVLFTGDLVFRGLTPVVDGSLRGWLDWMAGQPVPMPRIIVPGHGPAAGDWLQAIGPQQRLLKALADEIDTAIDRGVPMSRAVEDVANALEIHADDWVEFPQTMRRNATAAYKEMEWE